MVPGLAYSVHHEQVVFLYRWSSYRWSFYTGGLHTGGSSIQVVFKDRFHCISMYIHTCLICIVNCECVSYHSVCKYIAFNSLQI